MASVLVIGSGGREHAIVRALKKSRHVDTVYCAPGNAGIAMDATCLNIGAMDFDGLAKFLESQKDVAFTVATPDNPLVAGITNQLNSKGFRVFGPTKEAAKIEGSKLFAKELMKAREIPTANYKCFEDYDLAIQYLISASYPLVVKADGLAYGKGVTICKDIKEAIASVNSIMTEHIFGNDNKMVLIEEMLKGREVSLLVFTDGTSFKLMPSAQDHKRIGDGDVGPNTGGMGAFAPSPFFTQTLIDKTIKKIVIPTINAMNEMDRKFKGVLYFGLMICKNEPYVIEYNARFGDPETQAILPLLESDLFEIFDAVINEKLDKMQVKWKNGQALTVVAASSGYPGAYETGFPITIEDTDEVQIYHAGTAMSNGELCTSGGRVLAVTAIGSDLEASRTIAYNAIKKIKFKGMYYRYDIGKN